MTTTREDERVAPETKSGAAGVFGIFLRLGCTSFGGPIAHLGYFRAEFVERRRWLGEAAFADLVALCQVLPGPTSSQVGFAIGLGRAGLAGGAAASLAFTLPSLVLMLAAAAAAARIGGPLAGAIVHALTILAVAVVAQALLGMARSLCPDRPRAAIALAALGIASLLPGFTGQALALLLGAAAGLRLDVAASPMPASQAEPRGTFRPTVAALLLVAALLAGAALAAGGDVPALLGDVARAGALVFGGGHVVLPLLETAFVPQRVPADLFLAGYGAAQALPGPLFAFAAFLGAASGGPLLGLAATLAIFLPGFLVVALALPVWTRLRAGRRTGRVLAGINAAVVGILGAAFYDPIWTSGIRAPIDFVLASAAFFALVLWRAPPLGIAAVLVAGGIVRAVLGA